MPIEYEPEFSGDGDAAPEPPTSCPLCRIRMKEIGRLISFHDSAREAFVFAVCLPCTVRLERLPFKVQSRQLDAAIRNLERYPKRYYLKNFSSEIEARMFVSLEAERLRNVVLMN